MSDFEFLGRVTIGQYLAVDSPLHRLDARAKLLIFSFLLTLLVAAPHWSSLCVGVGVALVGLALGRVPLRYALRGLLPPLPFLLLLAALQVLLTRPAPLSPALLLVGPLALTAAGLWAGLTLLVRFCGLILALSLASFCLSTSHLVHGLESLLRPLQKLGLPVRDFILVIQVTLRFIPLLAQVAERVVKAQAARGADWGGRGGNLIGRVRRVIPLLVPLFMSSLHKAERMALAMDARAYGSVPQPTSMVEMHFTWRDGLAVTFAFGICLAAVFI